MSGRKPLVIVGGEIEQLQSGDYLSVPISGVNEVIQTNDEAGAIVIGAPVYNDAADGVKKAIATTSAASIVLGLVTDVSITNGATGSIAVSGVLTASTAQWDAVAGTTGGLTFGTRYYLDVTAGKISATAPSTVGQYVVEIGIALSTTELKINILKRVLL